MSRENRLLSVSLWPTSPRNTLISCTLHKTRARTLYPLCAGSGRQGLSNYYNLVSTFLGDQTKRWQITSISFHLPTAMLFSRPCLVREIRIEIFTPAEKVMFPPVCRLVGLFLSKITQKQPNDVLYLSEQNPLHEGHLLISIDLQGRV